MPKRLFHHENFYASGFFGDLLDAVIEVTRPPKPIPSKPKPVSPHNKDQPKKK